MFAPSLRAGVLVGFFLSGVTGLVYQGIWIRMLTLVLGGTTAALTTVLIAFMGGLALGSFLFGGLADRVRNPLRVYAVLEVAIGAYAIFLPSLYQQVPALYQALAAVDPARGSLFNLLRFSLALLFFGFPATLMGGTLPLIIKALSRGTQALQVAVAEVYAINTFGATLGAFLTGFVVIPWLGLDLTVYLTALVNLALGIVFWSVLGSRYVPVEAIVSVLPASGAPRAPWEEAAPTHEIVLGSAPTAGNSPALVPPSPARAAASPAPVPAPVALNSVAQRRLLLMVFFLMGASSLSYEVLWHRLLSLSFGSSVYAVSTMLTAFLLGIAIGSWWLRRQEQAPAPTWATLGRLELGIAISAPLTGLALAFLPNVAQYLFLLPYIATKLLGAEWADLGFWILQLCLFGVGAVLMLIPTTLMGASFPLAVRLYADTEIGSSVGRVYASNTFGSILGLALTGFVLIEAVGTRWASLGWSVVNGLLGLVLIFVAMVYGQLEARPNRHLLWPALALLCALILPPAWSLDTLTSGVYYHTLAARDGLLKGEILFSTEDELGLVSLHRTSEWDQPEPIRTLKFNGKFMGTDGNRVPVHHLFAHIPIFMRGEGARRALVIGIGGGYTVEAALQHPLEQVDAVEISPGIVEAASYTRPGIFEDKRLQVFEDDVRSLVLTGGEAYDVIISETSDPWMTGVSNLYTVEFFRWLKTRLAPGGVFGTWLQVRHKRLEDVQVILRTMQEVFPHICLFQVSEGDVMLVMSNAPLRLDADFLRGRHAQLEPQLSAINLRSPWQLPAMLVLDPASLTRYVQDAPLNTDDLPVIEFRTPRSLNIGLKGEEVRDVLYGQAPEQLELELLNARPSDADLWHAWRALHLGRFDQVAPLLERAQQQGAAPEPWLRAVSLFRSGSWQAALLLARQLPADPRQALLVAGCLLYLEDLPALREHLEHGQGWQTAGNSWEARIQQRRKLLLESLGVDSSSLEQGVVEPVPRGE